MAVQRLGSVLYSVAGFGNALTQDLAAGNAKAQSFFPVRNWEQVAREIDRHTYPRERIYTVLHNSAKELNAPPEAVANIEALRKPEACVVATGQQAGLFGGPLYSIYKALTAIKLARKFEAEARGARRFVPIFWVAGDDHDLAEIDHADLIGKSGTLQRMRLNLQPQSVGRSTCDVMLDAASLDALRTELSGAIEDEASASRLLDAYNGRNLSRAFATLLSGWLGPLGLVVVEAHDMRALASNVLLHELTHYETTATLIEGEAASLRVHGYSPGFNGKARPGPHFFITTEPAKIRARLEPSGAGTFHEHSPAFDARGENARSYSTEELTHLIREHPERFSASAALRPVVQQSIFPVAAAVLGPGEIDYWAQLKKVHDQFGAIFPLVVPRATLTLIDGSTSKALRKLEIEPNSPDIFGDEEKLKARILAGSEISRQIEERTRTILNELDKLAADVQTVDKGLNPLFDKTRERFAHELQRIAEKTAASLSQRGGANQSRLQQIATFVRPKNQPQERVLNCGQLMARYPNLPKELLETIDLDAHAHMILEVG
jgi:bacillithiol biosynthesis cysteine-adding enzyme BshC